MEKNKKRRIDVTGLVSGIFVLFPILIILGWGFVEKWEWPDLLPQVLSLRGVNEMILRREELIKVTSSSLFISLIVAALSVCIATMTARAVVFYEFTGKQCVRFLSILPFMIPATVVGMGLQVNFIKWGLSNSITGVVIIHLIYSLPYAVRIMTEQTEAIGSELEEQARNLGATRIQAFCSTTLIFLTPGMVTAACMAFLISFGQYFLTLLIGGGEVKTFTMVMVPYLQSGDRNIAALYSVLFIAMVCIVFAFFGSIFRRWTKKVEGELYR